MIERSNGSVRLLSPLLAWDASGGQFWGFCEASKARTVVDSAVLLNAHSERCRGCLIRSIRNGIQAEGSGASWQYPEEKASGSQCRADFLFIRERSMVVSKLVHRRLKGEGAPIDSRIQLRFPPEIFA